MLLSGPQQIPEGTLTMQQVCKFSTLYETVHKEIFSRKLGLGEPQSDVLMHATHKNWGHTIFTARLSLSKCIYLNKYCTYV